MSPADGGAADGGLAARLRARIARDGPLSVAAYMTLCLHDPDFGYYATRPRLGAAGDFITAPLVSQMFGELIGLWAAEIWAAAGRPPLVRLVEFGPGDATLMSDMLRASRLVPGFAEAAEVWLVEASAPLRTRQASALAGRPVRWAESLDALPGDAPLILIGNEFLDCLPIQQWVRGPHGPTLRGVGLDAAGDLAFTASGEITETSPALEAFGAGIGALLARAGGAALFIDYGRDAPGVGDTLQAVRGHGRESPLANPGAADLTAQVDFPAFLRAAEGAGGRVWPIRGQGDFLRDLGIEARAAALARARPDQAAVIARQLHRLTADAAMGRLFKAACVTAGDWQPAGFASAP